MVEVIMPEAFQTSVRVLVSVTVTSAGAESSRIKATNG